HGHLGRLAGRHLGGQDLEVAMRLPVVLRGGNADERRQQGDQEAPCPLGGAALRGRHAGWQGGRRSSWRAGGASLGVALSWSRPFRGRAARGCRGVALLWSRPSRGRAFWRPGLGRMRYVGSCHLSSPKPYLRPRSRLAAEEPPTVVRPSRPSCRPRLEPSRRSRSTAVITPPERLSAFA